MLGNFPRFIATVVLACTVGLISDGIQARTGTFAAHMALVVPTQVNLEFIGREPSDIGGESYAMESATLIVDGLSCLYPLAMQQCRQPVSTSQVEVIYD